MKYDCRKTLDYAHEHARMCSLHVGCECCPLENVTTHCEIGDITAEAVDVLQKWSDTHPEDVRQTDTCWDREIPEKESEEKTMELKDTVEMMVSEGYKERFKAEYFQLANRLDKLNFMLDKYARGTLDFTPACSYELLRAQASTMAAYMHLLEARAEIEGIDLSSLPF